MNIKALYRRKSLTHRGACQYVYPYLLRGIQATHPNHVWSIDITYISMAHGCLYMTAIIDVYSRYIVGWNISNSLESSASLGVVKEAIARYGAPEILNSDQGSQFTCKEYVSLLESEQIRISMDGKGRALDNVYIERFWRTLKYDYVYLNPSVDGGELWQGIKSWLQRYSHRPHQGIGNEKPHDRYFNHARFLP